MAWAGPDNQQRFRETGDAGAGIHAGHSAARNLKRNRYLRRRGRFLRGLLHRDGTRFHHHADGDFLLVAASEGRIVRQFLYSDYQKGFFDALEYEKLCTIRGRMGLSWKAISANGFPDGAPHAL